MALIKTKPTSPGRRFVVKADRSHLHKGEPVHALTAAKQRTGARNNMGRQTTRHKGGGHARRYRVVDFVRNKDGVPGKVEHDQIDRLAQQDAAQGLAVFGHHDFESFLRQVATEQITDACVIVDDQDLVGAGGMGIHGVGLNL